MPFKKPSWHWFRQDDEGKRKKKFTEIAVAVSKSQGDLSAAIIAMTSKSEDPAAGPSRAQNESLDWMPIVVSNILNTYNILDTDYVFFIETTQIQW